MEFGPYEIWEDVREESFDSQVAPELGDVCFGEAPDIYKDPREFFKRTYFTDTTIEILNRILDTLEGKERRNVFLIYSLFGGGKTHLLLILYHAFKTPEALEDPEVLEGYELEKRDGIKELSERIKLLKDNIKVVPVYGKGRIGQPSISLNIGPYSVNTIWGYIAHSFGKYSTVETYDRNLTVPDVDTLKDVFRGERVLLLIDEIADYVDNLYNSGSEEDRRYAKNVVNFLHRLSTALSNSTSSMVITLPMTEEGGSIRTQGEYNYNVVKALWDAVRRVGGAESYAPVRTVGISDELVEVLKKRIFKHVDPKARKSALEKIRSETSDVEIFGHGDGFTQEITRTYPFHPEYIQVLRTIIEKADLQRTRDMIRITRIVVRNLIDRHKKEGFISSIILPVHIDLTNDRIRGMLYGEKPRFADYASIIDTELANDEKYRGFKHPELARMVLTYVFLKTYPFDTPTPLGDFPTLTSISRAIYDPETFSTKQWLPADIKDVVEEIEAHPHFVFLNRKGGVFWFWRVANVTKMVDSKTEELIESNYGEIWDQLVRHVDQLVRKRKSIVTKRGKGSIIEEHVSFFDQVVVSKEPQELMDNELYKLFVLVSEDVDEKLLKGIIFQHGSGSRTYRNTVVVCYPVPGTMNHLITTTARDIACQRVMNTVKEMYGKYGEEVVEIQLNLVMDINNRALEELENQIVSSFRRAAYPVKDGIDIADAPSSSKSVVENVYSVLKSKGKIIDEFDFIEFANWLNSIGINILKPEGYHVSELRLHICSNPSAPMVEFENLKRSVKEAVRQLKVGLERKGEILFKKVYTEILGFEDEKGVEISEIEPDDIILPGDEALKRQVCELLKKEKDEIRNGKRYCVWYEVYLPVSGSSELLRNLAAVEDSECHVADEEAIMYGFIVERREEAEIKKGEFDLEVARLNVEGKPGEEVEVPVKITALGDAEVELSVDYGELSDQSVFLSEGESSEISWTLTVPSERRVVRIEAKSEEKMVSREIALVPKAETNLLETSALNETHRGTLLVSLNSIRDLDTLKTLPENLKGAVSGYLETENPRWKVQVEETERAVFEYVVGELEEFLGTKASLNVNLTLSEPHVIDDLLFEKLKTLNGTVSFILNKGERR